MKNKRKLYIIHPTFDMSNFDVSSTLLDNSVTDLTKDVYHTSLGDLPGQKIIELSKWFSEIEFVNTLFDKNSTIYDETLILLSYLSHHKTMIGYNPEPLIDFIDKNHNLSKPAVPTLWAFGCSHSHGVGLSDLTETYVHLLSEKLNMPARKITRPGSSTEWSLRHLMHSKIQKNDIVVWQITSPFRVSSATGEIMLNHTNNRFLLEVYNDNEIFFKHLNLIFSGISYLRLLGVRFVVFSHENFHDNYYMYRKEYTKYPEYCYIPDLIKDFGNDNQHPGPLTHKNIALCLLNHIQYKDV